MDFNITLRAAYQEIPHYEPLLWIAESPKMRTKYGYNILVTDGDSVELPIDLEAIITLDDMEPLDYWHKLVNFQIA